MPALSRSSTKSVRGGSVSLPREILLRLRRTGHAGARGQNGTYPTYRPAALGEFEASLKENPNRYRGLAGAARAAEAAGDRVKAVAYFEKLVVLGSKGDARRPELVHAQAFLGRR